MVLHMLRQHRTRYTALLLLLSLLLLCSCSEHRVLREGETYLDGSYYFSQGDLNVGYNFFPDGTGYLFIGSTVNPIRYGIYGQQFYLSVADGTVEVFPFATAGEDILINGLCYVSVKDDPSYAASAEALLSMQSKAEPPERSGELQKTLFFALSVCLAGGLILAVIRRKKQG